MRSIFDELRFGFRLLITNPRFTVIAAATLALGISVTTVMFSIIDTMYWKAFPGVPEPERLAELETVAPDGSVVRGSWLDFRQYRDGLRSDAGIAAHTESAFLVGPAELARPTWGEMVSANYFSVLGVRPVAGRVFAEGELDETPGAHPVAVISYRMWKDQFEGSPDVVGRTIRVNRHDLTILGVASPQFRGAMSGMTCDLWVPFSMAEVLGVVPKATFSDSSLRNIYTFGRLAPNVKTATVTAKARVIAQRLATLEPNGHRGFSAVFEPMWRAQIHGRAALLQPMLVLCAISVLILMIVCGNVANLLLARSVGRLREFGVRLALGASGWRLVRQTFLETLMLSLAGVAIGVPLAVWMTDSAYLLLPRLARASSNPIEMDGRVLVFAIGICLVAALASCVAPAFFVLRSDVNTTLNEGGRAGSGSRRSNRLRGTLVVAEIALALVVLIGAGLFLRSYSNASSADTGFDRKNVLLANFSVASGGFTVPELEQLCLRTRQRLEAAPGIAGAVYADYSPLWATDGPYTRAQPKGFLARNPEDVKVHCTSVSPGYFKLLKIPLIEGRDFTEQDDRQAQRVMIVDQAFARRFYRGESPVGREVMVRGKWMTIVGLVRDSKYFGFMESAKPHFYMPFRQAYSAGDNLMFFVRTSIDADAAIATIRREVSAIDPTAAGFNAAPLAEYNALLLVPLKFASGLLVALSVIAFLLCAVGLYGVMSFSVGQRTREMGIRMALGAQPRSVVGIVMRQGMRLTLAGIAAGLGLAAASMRLLATILVGVSPFDPATFLAACAFLVLVAAVATYLPAHRATRVDPFTAIRE